MSKSAKELADRVVALGVGHKVSDIHYALYNTNRIGIEMLTDQFINDGRVMLALMEKCLASGIDLSMSLQSNYFEAPGFWITGTLMSVSADIETERDGRESLCPAIIEACCEALENGQ